MYIKLRKVANMQTYTFSVYGILSKHTPVTPPPSLSFSLSFVDFFSKIVEFRVETVMIVLFMCKTNMCNFYHIKCNFCKKQNNVTILHTFFKKHLIESSVGMELFWATLKVAHLILF